MKKLLALLLIMTMGMTYTWNCFNVDELLNCNSTSITLNFTESGEQLFEVLYAPTLPYTVTNVTFTLTGNPVANWTYLSDTYTTCNGANVQVLPSNDIHAISFNLPVCPGGGGSSTHYVLGETGWNMHASDSFVDFDLLSNTSGFGVYGGNIYSYNGASWALNHTALEANMLVGIDMYNSTFGFAVGYDVCCPPALPCPPTSYVEEYNNGEWGESTLPGGNYEVYDVKFVNSGLAFASGSSSRIHKWNGSEWSLNYSGSVDGFYALDFYGDNLGFAVGEYGNITQWDGTDWTPIANITDNTLYAVDIHSASLAYAVGDLGTILKWDGSSWTNESYLGLTKDLTTVQIKSPTEVLVGGQDMTFLRYWGYPNGISTGWGSPSWSQPETELISAIWDNDSWDGFWNWGGTFPDSSFRESISMFATGPASVTITWEFTYGSKLNQSDIDWLAFTLDDYSTLVNETVVTEDSDVYVWNGTTLISKINMDFSSAPNYTGWSAGSGVSGLFGDGVFVFADSLNFEGAQNTSLKTLYLSNDSSYTRVCFFDELPSGGLASIETEEDCRGATPPGDYSRIFEKVQINGAWYYEIPNVANSGAVTIMGNSPQLYNQDVNPSNPNQFTPSIVFSVDVEYTGVETLVVELVGNGSLGTHDMTCTGSGVFSCSYNVGSLTVGNYSYYFRAIVGTEEYETSLRTLTITHASSAGVVTSAPGFGLELAVLLFIITALVMVFRE